MKNRPRIPTPDATTSNANEKENRFNLAPTTSIDLMNGSATPASTVSVGAGLTLIPANLQTNPNVTLLLQPIKEAADSNSAHSTLQAGTPATNALANTVLSDWRNGKFEEIYFFLLLLTSIHCGFFLLLLLLLFLQL